jgi:rubrerythrin
VIAVGGVTREAFLLRGAVAVTAASGAAAAGPFVGRALGQGRGGPRDGQILNFLLLVEYVQALLYRKALDDVPNLSGRTRTLIGEIRENEIEHGDALRETVDTIRSRPIDRPTVRFGARTFRTEARFLKLANRLEDMGVSAYNAAIPQLKSVDLIAATASIAQVEARHAALVRVLRRKPPAPLAQDRPSSQREVRAALEQFLR